LGIHFGFQPIDGVHHFAKVLWYSPVPVTLLGLILDWLFDFFRIL